MMERKYLVLTGVRQPPLDSRGGLIHVLAEAGCVSREHAPGLDKFLS